LYKSNDGKSFETLVADLGIDSYPNETSIEFKGDTAFCLLRRDGEIKTGLLGTALPPYTNWEWKDLGVRIGGPDMILLHDGRFVAAVRLYETDNWHPARTSLCQINPVTGKLSELLTLSFRRRHQLCRNGLASGCFVGKLLFIARGKNCCLHSKVEFK
jgi:hypothetical protein